MGLSASQARFLQLTARRSDIEYEVQQISFQRLALSEKMTAASTKYQDAVNNRKLTFSYNTGESVHEVDISYTNYKNYMNQQMEGLSTTQVPYYLVSSSGNKLVVPSQEEMNEMIEKNTQRIPISTIEAAKAKVEAYDTHVAQKAASTVQVEQTTDSIDAASEQIASEGTSTTSNAASTTAEAEEQAPPEPTEIERQYAAMNMSDYTIETTKDEDGNIVKNCLIQEFNANDFLIVDDIDNATTFQNALRNGTYYFATREYNETEEKYQFKIKGLDTLGAGAISDVLDKSDDAAAQAEYDLTQSKIQSVDKKLELRLDQLETERNAVQTEMDSVKKVIEDNIEQSFNVFS